MSSRFTPEQDKAIRAEYESGATLRGLAPQYDCCWLTIRSAILRAGGSIRSRIEARALFTGDWRRKATNVDRKKMVRLYLSGYGLKEAANACGFKSQSACEEALKDAGVPQRKSHSGRIKQRMSEARRVYGLNERFFETVDTPKKAWLLGFIAADGNVCGNAVRIGLARCDRSCLEMIANLVEWQGPICDDMNSKDHPRSTLHFASRRMATDLMALGIVPRKSLILQAWNGPESLLPHYFRGLVDGDGWISRRKGWYLGLCGSRSVVEAFEAFVKHRVETNAAIRPFGKIYLIEFGGAWVVQQVASILYRDAAVSLERKRLMAEKLMALPVKPHKSWEYLTAEDLEAMYEQEGSWVGVAAYLETDLKNLYLIRRRLNMRIEPRGGEPWRWTHITDECLLDLRRRLGNWSDVARHIGMQVNNMWRLRKRLGCV